MIGHGTLGLRDGIPTFRDITGRSNARGYPLVECGFGKELPAGQWALHSGTTWQIRANFIIGGILRDILSVDTTLGTDWATALVRTDTLALCQATLNSFFADTTNARVPQEYWDQATTPPGWDSWGAFFDQYPPLDLYINLGGVDPNSVVVVAELGFFYAPRAVRHPVLGKNLLLNGGLDALTGSVPTSWTSSTTGSSPPTLFRDNNVYRGTGAQGLVALNAGLDSTHMVQQSVALTSDAKGGVYRFSGAYMTADHASSLPGNADQQNTRAWLGLRFTDGITARQMLPDGLTWALSGTVFNVLTATYGRWRRFVFEFVWPSTLNVTFTPFFGAYAAAGGANGLIYFDDVSFRRVHRYHDYEDRLVADSTTMELETAVTDPFLGRRTLGLGGVSLSNGIGERSLARQIGGLLHARRPVRIIAAGVVDGIDLVRDDCYDQFYGRINTVEASDNQVSFGLEDPISDLLETKLPLRVLNSIDTPTATAGDMGRARQALWGDFSEMPMRVPRISKSPTTGYGTYEVADPHRAPNGIYEVSAVRVHRSAQLFSTDPLGGRLLIASPAANFEYTVDLAAGTVTIVKDVREVFLDSEGKDLGTAVLDADIGGANVPFGFYGTSGWPPWYTAQAMANAFTIGFGVTVNVTYSDVTHKFSIQRADLGVINLRIKTGPNKETGQKWWRAMGYTEVEDRLGSGPHESDEPIFEDADRDHIIGIQATGYKDTAAGTYTGFAGFRVSYPSYQAHMILREWLKVPVAKIDVPSFDVGTVISMNLGSHTLSAMPTRIRAREQETARIILQRLAQGAMASLYTDGEGIWHWEPLIDVESQSRPAGITTPLIHITDDDILPGTWGVYQRRSNAYKSVSVSWEQSAARADEMETETITWDPDVQMKYGREETLNVRSYHYSDLGAKTQEVPGGPYVSSPGRLARVIGKMSAAPMLAVNLSVRHRLSDHKVNDRFLLTRDDAFAPGGFLANVAMRILTIRHNYNTGITHVLAVKDVSMGISGGQMRP